MCIGKGMIIRKGRISPDYALDSNDHSPLVKKLKLKDDKLEDRDFVRIELWPKNSLTSTKEKDWGFRVDEAGTLPLWFRKTQEDWRLKCLAVLFDKIIPKWVKKGVGGSLDLGGTQVKSLPKQLKVKGTIYKDF